MIKKIKIKLCDFDKRDQNWKGRTSTASNIQQLSALGSKEHWLGVEKKSKVSKPKSTTYSSSDIYRIFPGFIWDFSFYKEQSTSFHRETDQIYLNHITNKYHPKSQQTSPSILLRNKQTVLLGWEKTPPLSDKITVMHIQISKRMTHLSEESSTETCAVLTQDIYLLQQQWGEKGRKVFFFLSLSLSLSILSFPLALSFLLSLNLCNL